MKIIAIINLVIYCKLWLNTILETLMIFKDFVILWLILEWAIIIKLFCLFIYLYSKMLKKLKSNLFSSEVEKQLEKAKINKSHELVQPRNLNALTNFILSPKSKN